MCGNRGFTLLELLVALVVLAVGFSVVFEVLSFARLEYSSAYELSGDIIKLNNALVERKGCMACWSCWACVFSAV